MSTILVLRALGLGDFFTGVPALRLISRVRPEVHIVLATPARFGDLALRAGVVDEVLDYDGLRELRPLPSPPGRPDVAIDLHGNGPASRAVLQATAPRRLIAFSLSAEAGSTARWDPTEHEVARWCRLVAAGLHADPALGGGVAGSLPHPDLRPGVPAGSIIVHPGASARSRQWPVDRFITVARQMRSYGRPVVVTGSPSERPVAEGIARAAGARALTSLSLDELLALVAHAFLVVSGDTGVAHAASTFAVPSVVLFGPVSPALWGPPRVPIHRALHHPAESDPPGDPHGQVADPALLRIQPAEVIRAAAAVRAAADTQAAA